MNFHLGKPILVLAIVAVVTGAARWWYAPPRKADLIVWVFAETHDRTYRKIIPKYEKETGVTVNLNLLHNRAVTTRLGELFMSNNAISETPDLVEMEISLAGRFFRPSIKEMGFLPLDKYLDESGWRDKLVQSRLATWSKEGIVFGIPHDIHPCAITYRDDLYRAAGIDLSAAKTWPEFHQACLKFERYWKNQGFKYRHAVEMQESSAETFQAMLLQRHINPIDSYGNIYLEDPKVAETLAIYAQMVAGPKKISAQTPPNFGTLSRDIEEGNICAFITADWRVTYIKLYGAGAAGKMRLMPLPIFDPGDAPTSTIGGTMIGIPKASKHPDEAWKLIEYLYFSPEAIRISREVNDLLPPIKTIWSDPMYHQPDPYFGGQKGMELLAHLAEQLPARYITAASPLVNTALNEAVAEAAAYVNEHGSDGLDEQCRKWMKDIARDLRSRMQQWKVD